MSLLDQVRERYRTPRAGTDKSDKSPSVSFDSPQDSGTESSFGGNAPNKGVDILFDFDREKARRDAERRTEQRRKRLERVIKMMAEDEQSRKYYWATDDKAHPEFVFLTLAIRDVGTCEMSIPKEKYDPFLLMAILDTQNRSGVDS